MFGNNTDMINQLFSNHNQLFIFVHYKFMYALPNNKLSASRQAEENVFLENKAATTIQRYFRGYITRKHIKHVNKCATTIQRNWRGIIGRRHYYQLLVVTGLNHNILIMLNTSKHIESYILYKPVTI